MVDFQCKSRYGWEDFLEIMRLLRAPGGCPWDAEQTHESIRREFLKETYETLDAIDHDDPAGMCEELGDMLMQVLFNIHMEEDAGRLYMDDVTDRVCKKLIFRHPHIFSPGGEALTWDELKRREKGQKSTAEAMDAVAGSLPALWRAEKLQKKAAAAGFDYADVSGALDKLDEETAELRSAVNDASNFEEELGDVLFAAVKVGRFCGVDPEQALHGTCEKFLSRFRYVEQRCKDRGAAMDSLPLETLESLWNEAKHSV